VLYTHISATGAELFSTDSFAPPALSRLRSLPLDSRFFDCIPLTLESLQPMQLVEHLEMDSLIDPTSHDTRMATGNVHVQTKFLRGMW
jgi:hypothetical protein